MTRSLGILQPELVSKSRYSSSMSRSLGTLVPELVSESKYCRARLSVGV